MCVYSEVEELLRDAVIARHKLADVLSRHLGHEDIRTPAGFERQLVGATIARPNETETVPIKTAAA